MNNTFKIFFRLLKRNKITSFITIGGFAISMSVFLILYVFLAGEKKINSSFVNAKSIYRIERSNQQSIVPLTLLDDIRTKVPEIEKTALYCITRSIYTYNNQRGTLKIIATNDDFLDMFSFQYLYKNAHPSLSGKSDIVLTAQFSEKLYGKENPVGEILQLNSKNYNVVGVVTDIPDDASFHFDALVNIEVCQESKMGYHNESHLLYNAFIMLNRGVPASQVEDKLQGMISHWKAFENDRLSIRPLKDVYFNGLSGDSLDHANVQLIYLLATIALIILFMTIFNYVNMTISGSTSRMAEFGVKKTTGAAKAHIFTQIILESVLTSLIAMFLALVLANLFAPVFSDILGKPIEVMNLFSKPAGLIIWAAFSIGIGVVSGVYPSLVFSGISPLQLIGKRYVLKKQQRRSGVIAIQFLISTVLIISLFFIQKQIDFVKHKDYGFNTELLLSLRLEGNATQKSDVIKEELLSYPQIVSVCAVAGNPMMTIPGSSSNKFDINGEKKSITVNQMAADADFVKTMGLKLIAGRDFNPVDSNSCLINEHLYRDLELTDLEGQSFQGRKIVGVLQDFHFEKLYNTIGNIMIEKDDYAWWLNVRIRGNISEDLDIIKQAYVKVEPDLAPNIVFFDDYIQNLYQKEERQAKAIQIFAVLAVLISCLGLIGTAEQTIKRRTKEIGIRKVNGAKIHEILAMLNKDFVKWVVISFLVATPVAWYAMHKWLESFAYKTELSWWIFALAGVLALGIALLTVSVQSWRAATRNPVEALRYE